MPIQECFSFTLQCRIEATWLLFGTCLLFGSCHFHKYGPHSGGKCDVTVPKKHVPMGTKVGKVPNKLYQGYLYRIWTFSQKKISPQGSLWGTQSPQNPCPWVQKIFLDSIPQNKVPLSLPHHQNIFLGSNVVLFLNQEANFEAAV